MNTIFTRSDPDLARFFNPLLLSCRLLLRFILLTKRPEQVICSENGKVGFQKILNELALKKYLAYIREADYEDLSNLCLSNMYCKCRRRIRHVYSL